MAITSDGMLLGHGFFQELKKKKIRICLNKGGEKKNRESGIELYSVSWETENEQMVIKNAEIYKYGEKTKNVITIKMDQVGSSY